MLSRGKKRGLGRLKGGDASAELVEWIPYDRVWLLLPTKQGKVWV